MRHLGDGRLHAWLVEVGEEGILKRGMVVLQHASELQKLLAAVGKGTRRPGPERRMEPLVHLRADNTKGQVNSLKTM